MSTYLIFGASGQTGKHFTTDALADGHTVRALARNLAKFGAARPNLEIHEGSITDSPDLERLVEGVDFVVSLLGDAQMQRTRKINTEFVRGLVPAMRRSGVSRFLYQAGGLSAPPNEKLSPALWAIRNTLARGFIGQHEDNEAVMQYLTNEAMDIEWMIHRASIRSDGPSKGVLERSRRRVSVATFSDCAAYGYRLLHDTSAIHTTDVSAYRRN